MYNCFSTVSNRFSLCLSGILILASLSHRAYVLVDCRTIREYNMPALETVYNNSFLVLFSCVTEARDHGAS